MAHLIGGAGSRVLKSSAWVPRGRPQKRRVPQTEKSAQKRWESHGEKGKWEARGCRRIRKSKETRHDHPSTQLVFTLAAWPVND